ncbi:MAG: hypothetical protein HRU19_12930 [Pseudobacteriovorax sp.]|nr:hypothetical protein [Pseudobacteriovorax sp.]
MKPVLTKTKQAVVKEEFTHALASTNEAIERSSFVLRSSYDMIRLSRRRLQASFKAQRDLLNETAKGADQIDP